MSPELEAARAKAEVLDSEGHLYAQAAWREAADGALKAYGENDPRVHAARARLARSLLLHGWLDYRESRETAAAAGAALAAAAAASPGGAGGKEGRQLAEEAAAALSVEAWAALQGGELGPAREILARALALLPGGEDKARGALALALRSRLAQALVAKGLDRSPPGEAQAGKALELFAGCADEAAVIYGPGSPEARRARLGVASALAALGRPEEAEAWLEEAFAEEGCAGGCAGYLGPEALRCARLIADFFKGEGLLDRAGEMYLRILRAELEQTAACGRPCLEPAASLAGLYWPPQSPARRELLLRAAGILDGILGPLDPGTIEAKKTAADALFGYSDSVALLREAWDAQKRTLGEDSPEAAETARILAGRLTRLEGFELASPAAADLAWSLREEGRGLSLLLFERDLRARGAGGLEAESGLSCVRAEAFFRLELPFQVLECRDRLSVMERVLGPRHPAAAAERRELAAAADRVGGGPLLALAMRDLPGAGGAPEVAAPAPWGPPGDPRESLAAEALAAEDWAAAADMYRGLLELRDSGPGPESPEAARAALGLARALRMLGDFPGALAAAGRAAASTERERGPGSPEALEARGVEARILFDSGDYGRALAAARSALKAAGEGPALPPAALEAEISLAGVLDALGSGSEALEILTAAWLEALYAGGPDSRPYLAARAAAADVLIGAGDFIAARRILEEVLLARKISSGERAQETLEALSSWGRVNARMGDWAAAEAAFREALEARREALGPARPRALESLVSLAGAVAAQGRGDEAKALLLEALTGLESALGSGHPRTAEAAAALGEICLLEGELSAAAFYLKVAVSADQRTRGGLLALDRVLQDGYLVSVRRHYDLLVKALLLSGKAAEAQEVIGLLKEAETRPPWPEETSRKPREAPPSAAAPPGGRDDGTLFAGTADEAARRAFREAADTLSAMGRERAALAGRKRAGELDEAGEARLSEIDARLSEASREFLDLCGSLRERLSAAGEQGKVKAVELLESRQRTLEAMGEGTVLVHALSTEDSLYLFLTTPYALAVKESPVPRQELSAMATRLAALLRDGSRDPRPAAKALWDVLMAPIEGELEGAGARTLMFSLDGPLRYVPVAALWDGERWLAERHPTALFTEASLDKLRDGPASAPRAMALGVTREVGGLPKLDGVAGEIAAVVGDAAAGPSGDGRPAPSFGAGAAEGAAGALPGEAFLDEDFTAERLSGCLSSGADVVHVASHFSFDGLDRWDSFLLLGDGSRLSLRSIRSERAYDFAGLDLLTLSACDTASGVAGGNGSELESFGDTVLLKGAMAVLASLWPVGDESTAALMREFYRLRYLEGLDKAAALQGAQLSLMKGEAGPSSQAAPRRGPVSAVPLREAEDAPPWTGTGFTHPVHWAPFIVMGNWR